ncbi:MAG: hypothetical protein CR971_01350 [candidate division SR1 bacterium]|nr:MAG: hypothetical protein CR971_01350 [candidate division SR1 bacterium]
MKHFFYWIIIFGLLGSFFWIEIKSITGIEKQNTQLENYLQEYHNIRESNGFWIASAIQRTNISLLTDTMIDTDMGMVSWENRGRENTPLHFARGYPIDKYSTLELKSETPLAFQIHHYLYKKNIHCSPNDYPEQGGNSIHDILWIDTFRNKRSQNEAKKELMRNEGLGSNCFLQGEVMPLGNTSYSGNTHYQLSLPKISGLDDNYKIYSFYSITHTLDKEKYTINWELK